MSIFDLFKSKKSRQTANYEAALDISIKLFEIIKRKKKYSDMGAKDYKFSNNMNDKLLVLTYYKKGALDFIDKEFRNTIVRVCQSDELSENYKLDVEISFFFLEDCISQLTATIEKSKSTSN